MGDYGVRNPGFLRPRVLRYWVCLQLAEQQRTMTVAELAARLEARGLRVKARPSKAISDTLRWAEPRGWAIKIGRGRYGPGRIPESTLRYMRTIVSVAIREGDPLLTDS